MRALRKRVRGALSSIELLLILGAVITFAVIIINGLFKQVSAQASSSKYLLEISSLDVRRMTTQTTAGWYDGLQISLIVSNFGTDTVYVYRVLVKCSYGEKTISIYDIIGRQLEIEPGESKTISFVTNACVYAPRVYVELETSAGSVGEAATVH